MAVKPFSGGKGKTPKTFHKGNSTKMWAAASNNVTQGDKPFSGTPGGNTSERGRKNKS